MVYVLIWVIVGGTATIYGPILGVAALTVVNEIVLRGLGVDQARPLVYGAILIASILFLPDGLESLGPKMKRAFARIRGLTGSRSASRRPAGVGPNPAESEPRVGPDPGSGPPG